MEDFEAARQSIDEGDYPRLIVQSNRAITEATVWGDKPALASTALVARLAALTVQTVSGGNPLEYPQKQAVAALFAALASTVKTTEPQASMAWEAYERFHKDFWLTLRPKIEGKAYSDNPEFVANVLAWALETVHGSWLLLVEPTGSPLAGVVNEIDRVMKAHGATSRQLASYGLLQSLAWYSEYAQWQTRKTDGNLDPEKTRGLLEPVVSQAVTILSESSVDTAFYGKVADFAFSTLQKWRRDFVLYYDLYQFSEKEKERVGIRLIQRPKEREPTTPAASRKRKHHED